MKLLDNLLAFLFCIMTFGLVDIEIRYSDGTRFKWVGWVTRIINISKKFKTPHPDYKDKISVEYNLKPLVELSSTYSKLDCEHTPLEDIERMLSKALAEQIRRYMKVESSRCKDLNCTRYRATIEIVAKERED